MLQTQERTTKEEEMLKNIVEKLEKSGYTDIKVDLEGYEQPAKLVRQSDDTEFIPDITARLSGKKFYFEIVRKTKEVSKLVAKWKLLSALSEIKDGDFKIFVPYGQMKFTKEILEKYRLNAEIAKI